MQDKTQTTKTTIERLGEQSNNTPGAYFAFTAGLANDSQGHRQFLNEFILELAITDTKSLAELVNSNQTAFPFLLAIMSYVSQYNSMNIILQGQTSYAGEYAEVVESNPNLEDYISAYINQFENYNEQNSEEEQFLQDRLNNLSEAQKSTPVKLLVQETFENLERLLKENNQLDDLYKGVIKVENELITDFDNIANTQLSYLKLTQDGLDPTLNLLKNVNQLCEHQNFSNEKQAVQEIGEALQKIQESGMPDMFNRSEKEEKLESTEEITDFNEAIETLRSIKSDLAAGLKLKDLITKVSAAFKNQIQDDDFKKLEQKLQEIADKQDLDGFAKFLDKAIEFFKSIVGKDRISQAEKATTAFSEKISSKKTAQAKIESQNSQQGLRM